MIKSMREENRSGVNFKKLAGLSSLGLMLPSSIAVGLFIGFFLDKLLGTRPWLLILFFLLGTASGFYSLLKGLKNYLDKEKDV
jgi:ATP synthase protein I